MSDSTRGESEQVDGYIEELADDLDVDAAELDGEWSYVRELFRSSDNGTTGVAKQNAARILLNEFNIVTAEETNDDEKDVWRYDPTTGIFENDGIFRTRQRLAEGLDSEYSRSRVNDIIHRIRSETYAKRDTLGAPEHHICLTNGVLNITDASNPVLHDHSPEYHFTWRINAAYDPDAESVEFKPFIGQSVRPEDIAKLQEYAGGALRHWKQPRNLCVILGPTDAGKGVFMRTLKSVFGDGNVASETLTELTDTRWGAASLVNRPINLANELSTGLLERPERAKNFAGGGDTISAEDKGESKFELLPTANHIFATNQVPQVQNADEAFYNRWLFVTFPNSVPTDQQDEDLDMCMTESDEERSAILNWLLEGYARRQQRTGTAFDGERTIAEKEEMWAAYGDSVDRYIANCLDTEDATGDDAIVKKDAYAAYKSMCNTVGVSVHGQKKLTKELNEEAGVGHSKRTVDAHFDDSKRPAVYTGVRFTDSGQDHLNTAIAARDAVRDAKTVNKDADGQQTGLNEHRSSHMSQNVAINTITTAISGMTDEGRGEPVHVDDVIDAVPHTEERARHLIGKLIDQGSLIEEPENHVAPVR